jgi:phage shock protein A
MNTRDDDVQETYAMLASLDAELDALTKRAENAGADLRDEIAEIRARQDEAHARLASMRDSGGAAWPDLKGDKKTAAPPSGMSR